MINKSLSGTNFVNWFAMKLSTTFIGKSKQVNVIIETPKNSGNKHTYQPESGLFKLSKILPEALVFPLHIGLIPHTLSGWQPVG